MCCSVLQCIAVCCSEKKRERARARESVYVHAYLSMCVRVGLCTNVGCFLGLFE